MLYIFHGTDVDTSLKKARTLVNSLRAKKKDAAFLEIDSDHWNRSLVEEQIGGQGLFSPKSMVFLNRVTEKAEAKEEIIDLLKPMAESENVFVILEGKVNVELKKAFEKQAEKAVTSDFKESGVSTKKDFNVFALADALGNRDSFRAWNVYREALEKGIEPENIVGTLFWQVKSMVLAAKAVSASQAGLNPFVFGKAKKYAGNYSELELKNLVSSLITLYHDGHRGLNDLELSIERLLLAC